MLEESPTTPALCLKFLCQTFFFFYPGFSSHKQPQDLMVLYSLLSAAVIDRSHHQSLLEEFIWANGSRGKVLNDSGDVAASSRSKKLG